MKEKTKIETPVEYCGTVYMLTNRITTKKYVGQTTRPLARRIADHREQGRLKNPRMLIHHSIKKYGFENFTVEVLATCENQQALDWAELHFAKLHDAFVPNGYNLRAGTGRGSASEETKRKIGLGSLGRITSEETRQKISEARTDWHANKTEAVETERRRKIGESRAEDYVLRSPTGERVEVTNLSRWSADNGFTRTQACKLALVVVGKDRSVKGWSLWVEPGLEDTTGFRKIGYSLCSPEGEKVFVPVLKDFCVAKGFTTAQWGTMRKVVTGTRKGFQGWTLWVDGPGGEFNNNTKEATQKKQEN